MPKPPTAPQNAVCRPRRAASQAVLLCTSRHLPIWELNSGLSLLCLGHSLDCSCCACDLDNCLAAESALSGCLSCKKGLSSRVAQIQFPVGSPHQEAMLRHHAQEIRCPALFQFCGDRWRYHPESPGFCIFSPLYHLSSCHPNWVACALYMLSSAGFGFCGNQLCQLFPSLKMERVTKHAN